MERLIYRDLLEWKDSPDRKPLILEGIRQCGKTYILREFGRREYDNFVYFNFEERGRIAEVFEGDLDPDRIITELNNLTSKKIRPRTTLLILDEVQEAPAVLTAMKYFCEEAPEYHVVCAGSLLGLPTSRPESFPVGKVDRLRMYPMTFTEFLTACGKDHMAEYIRTKDPGEDAFQPLHDDICGMLREYYVVGGMPAAVRSWATHHKKNYVTRILRTILGDYASDFSKHAPEDIPRLTAVWSSIPFQLARGNERFLFGEAVNGGITKDLADSARWLVEAGMAYMVPITDMPTVPLSINADPARFRLYLADVGLMRVMTGKGDSAEATGDPAQGQYKGAMTENYVLTQLIASGFDDVCCWKSGRDEVDFLVQSGGSVIPVEVKAETKASARSLAPYMDRFGPPRAVVLSMRGKGGDTAVPLYCAEMLASYLGLEESEPDPPDTDAAPVPSVPYRRVFGSEDWTQGDGGYRLSVAAAEHGRGIPAIIQVYMAAGDGYSEVTAGKSISSRGDVTLSSSAPFDGFVSLL